MADTASKAIAARVPISDYLKFLNEAIDMKISMQDWLCRKIYSEDKATAFEKKIKSLESDLATSKKSEAQTKEKLDGALKSLKEGETKASKMLNEERAQIISLKKTIQEYEKSAKSLIPAKVVEDALDERDGEIETLKKKITSVELAFSKFKSDKEVEIKGLKKSIENYQSKISRVLAKFEAREKEAMFNVYDEKTLGYLAELK